MPIAAPPQTPPKWFDVYQGDKECRFFKALSRGKGANNQTLEWRTTAGLMKAASLKQHDVEQIIQKYLPTGVVEQHSKEGDKFRYWANASKPKTKKGSISNDGKKRRVDDSLDQASKGP